MKWKWCDPYWLACGNWMCTCNHINQTHALGVCLEEKCSCDEFQFLNNDLCTIECMFYRKLYETEKSS